MGEGCGANLQTRSGQGFDRVAMGLLIGLSGDVDKAGRGILHQTSFI